MLAAVPRGLADLLETVAAAVDAGATLRAQISFVSKVSKDERVD